jgi:hypothetical protein
MTESWLKARIDKGQSCLLTFISIHLLFSFCPFKTPKIEIISGVLHLSLNSGYY